MAWFYNQKTKLAFSLQDLKQKKLIKIKNIYV
jgi:hypothetical protein